MISKRKDQSLDEFMANLPPNTWAEIPTASLTLTDYRRLFAHDPMQTLLSHLEHGSPRDLVSDGSGMVEDELNHLLSTFVVPSSTRRLFGRSGKLRDFELKIELAFALGLISADERSLIHVLRKIRNRFAHETFLRAFDVDEEVLGLVRSISATIDGPKFEIPLAWRFLGGAASMYHALRSRKEEALRHQRKEHKGVPQGGSG